ncbi:hypothetical protein V2J15_06245 [Georgenia sp. MJ170]|uniref:hypothetical protein n=1 Tax=Georgenia sunbinii TaxID=3117728 RepID=UPI002F26DC01
MATLIEAGIFAVVRERRVRGAVERTLALGGRAPRLDAAGLGQMSTGELRRAFAVFLAHLAADVDRFLEADSAGQGEVRDLMGLGQMPLRVSVDELGALQQELQAVLQRYVDTGEGDSPRVVLSTVLLPST